MFTLISYQEGVSGYYENDWQIIKIINSPKEFLEALKEGYLEDASNRSQFPINGFPIKYIYLENRLYKHEGYTFLGGGYNDDSFEPENPDFRSCVNEQNIVEYINANEEYKLCFLKFEKWKKKIKSLIPRIRELKRKKEDIEKEIKTMFYLAEKYGYKIEMETKKCIKT